MIILRLWFAVRSTANHNHKQYLSDNIF